MIIVPKRFIINKEQILTPGGQMAFHRNPRGTNGVSDAISI